MIKFNNQITRITINFNLILQLESLLCVNATRMRSSVLWLGSAPITVERYCHQNNPRMHKQTENTTQRVEAALLHKAVVTSSATLRARRRPSLPRRDSLRTPVRQNQTSEQRCGTPSDHHSSVRRTPFTETLSRRRSLVILKHRLVYSLGAVALLDPPLPLGLRLRVDLCEEGCGSSDTTGVLEACICCKVWYSAQSKGKTASTVAPVPAGSCDGRGLGVCAALFERLQGSRC